jgi:hypothetical protein
MTTRKLTSRDDGGILEDRGSFSIHPIADAAEYLDP